MFLFLLELSLFFKRDICSGQWYLTGLSNSIRHSRAGSSQLPQPAKDFPLCSSCNTTIFQDFHTLRAELLITGHLPVSGILWNNDQSCFVWSLNNFIQHFLRRSKIKLKKKNTSVCPNPERARISDPQQMPGIFFFFFAGLTTKPFLHLKG